MVSLYDVERQKKSGKVLSFCVSMSLCPPGVIKLMPSLHILHTQIETQKFQKYNEKLKQEIQVNHCCTHNDIVI